MKVKIDEDKFNSKQLNKLIKHLTYLFEPTSEPLEIGDNDIVIVEDKTIGIKPLTERAKKLLSLFNGVVREDIKLKDNGVGLHISYYGLELLDWAIGLIYCSDDTVKVTTYSKDYPLTLTSYDWKIIIAPRVVGD